MWCTSSSDDKVKKRVSICLTHNGTGYMLMHFDKAVMMLSTAAARLRSR